MTSCPAGRLGLFVDVRQNQVDGFCVIDVCRLGSESIGRGSGVEGGGVVNCSKPK